MRTWPPLLPGGAPHSVPMWVGLEGDRVAERVEGDEAWQIIDRMSHKYIGQDYPLRADRIVLFIEPEHSRALSL